MQNTYLWHISVQLTSNATSPLRMGWEMNTFRHRQAGPGQTVGPTGWVGESNKLHKHSHYLLI
jgi:hypothetical protein